jgi:hypothetical protein
MKRWLYQTKRASNTSIEILMEAVTFDFWRQARATASERIKMPKRGGELGFSKNKSKE